MAEKTYDLAPSPEPLLRPSVLWVPLPVPPPTPQPGAARPHLWLCCILHSLLHTLMHMQPHTGVCFVHSGTHTPST